MSGEPGKGPDRYLVELPRSGAGGIPFGLPFDLTLTSDPGLKHM